VTEHEKLGE
jgi:chromosome segregation ATPase